MLRGAILMNRVQNSVALVTGGASGIGFAIAELLAAEGATVILTDINAQAGEKAAAQIGGAAKFFQHDVASETDWARVVRKAEAQFGQLNILVNNAGISLTADVEQTSLEQFRR